MADDCEAAPPAASAKARAIKESAIAAATAAAEGCMEAENCMQHRTASSGISSCSSGRAA
jgi:hypothetical protein